MSTITVMEPTRTLAQSYKEKISSLGALVTRYEGCLDKPARRLHKWAADVFTLSLQNRQVSLESIQKVAQEKLHELQDYLTNPLLDVLLVHPILVGDMLFEDSTFQKCRNHFEKTFEQSAPVRHVFAEEMVAWLASFAQLDVQALLEQLEQKEREEIDSKSPEEQKAFFEANLREACLIEEELTKNDRITEALALVSPSRLPLDKEINERAEALKRDFMEKLGQVREAYDSRLSDLRSEKEFLEHQLGELEREVDADKERNSKTAEEMKKKLEDNREKIRLLEEQEKAQTHEYTNTVSRLQRAFDSLGTEGRSAMDSLERTHRETATRLEGEVATAKSEKEEMAVELERTLRRVFALEGEVRSLSISNAQMRHQLAEMNERIANADSGGCSIM